MIQWQTTIRRRQSPWSSDGYEQSGFRASCGTESKPHTTVWMNFTNHWCIKRSCALCTLQDPRRIYDWNQGREVTNKVQRRDHHRPATGRDGSVTPRICFWSCLFCFATAASLICNPRRPGFGLQRATHHGTGCIVFARWDTRFSQLVRHTDGWPSTSAGGHIFKNVEGHAYHHNHCFYHQHEHFVSCRLHYYQHDLYD